MLSHPFLLQVKHERIELLEHPLVAELMSHKWNKIAMPSILLQLTLYLIFLGFLTTYVLMLPNPRGDVCARSKNSSYIAKQIYTDTVAISCMILSELVTVSY